MTRVLYVDRPFINEIGGDKNRSRYLFNALSQFVPAKSCIVFHPDEAIKEDADLTLCAYRHRNILMPYAVYRFIAEDIRKLISFIQAEQINIVFIRTIAFSELARAIKKVMPDIRVIIDVDLLLSRLMKQSWDNEKALKRRFFLIQWILLNYYESGLFKNDYTFLLTNSVEIDLLQKRFPTSRFTYLQNTTDLLPSEPAEGENNQVVFYGAMNSSANLQGYKFLHEAFYPLISDVLEKNEVELVIAGKGCEALPPSKHSRLKVIGKVDSIEALLKQSKFIFLPIFIASGTNTRVIETAMAGRAVLTTSLGMEGLINVDGQEYIADDKMDMADRFKKMVEDRQYTIQLAQELQGEIVANFSYDVFKNNIEKLLLGS